MKTLKKMAEEIVVFVGTIGIGILTSAIIGGSLSAFFDVDYDATLGSIMAACILLSLWAVYIDSDLKRVRALAKSPRGVRVFKTAAAFAAPTILGLVVGAFLHWFSDEHLRANFDLTLIFTLGAVFGMWLGYQAWTKNGA